MRTFKSMALFAVLAATIAAHRPAHAGLIVTTETNPSQTFFPAAGDDLINAGAATLAGETHTGFTPFEFQGGLSNTAALNDGLIGTAGALVTTLQ
jgi:hypothetical protein